MATHQISVEADPRAGGRVTYHYLCTCGSKNYGSLTRAAAEHAGRQHQAKEAGRG